jgi:acyl-CoA synthetase (AMP-forming)/AMP-acid ligase II
MTMQRTPLLLSRLMDRGAWIAPNEEIVTRTSEGVHRETYAEAHDRSHQLAHALKDFGIREGDRVASLLWNGYRHLEMYHAVPCMGAVLHTLNLRLSPRDLEYIINHAADRIIVIDADLIPLLEQLAGKIPSVELVVVASEDGKWTSKLPRTVDYEDFIRGKPARYEWPELDENAPMGLCYTSGTTGNPKGAMYTHRSTYLHTMAVCLADTVAISALDSICGIVPMFHAMGWGLPFAANMVGAKQVMPHRFMTPENLLDLFETEDVTISAGVPTIWQGAKAAIESHPGRWKLEHLERVTCGGSAPPVSLIRWFWEALGVEMIQGWGMTETNPLASLSRRVGKRSQKKLPDDALFANNAKAGLVIPGLEVKIVNERFEALPSDGESMGELLIRGPWIISEYYNDPQPAKFHEGWLITGDVAKMDADQYVIICDRSKDLIKSGGEWISSVDLENHIVGMAGVKQAAVVAHPHPKWDERPVALVVRTEGASDEAVSKDAVIAHCAKAFAKWQLPDDVLLVETLPLTSTGKLDKKVIRADLASKGYKLPDLRG